MNLYLLRGLPGAGKSTIAKELNCVNFEADQFFLDENSDYKFDPTKLKDAHAWCQSRVKHCMTEGIQNISVSNTFTQEWEMEAYYNLAKEYNYRVFSIIVENRHGGKNLHGVPEDKLQVMNDRFQIKLK